MNRLKEFSGWSINVTSEHEINFYVDHECLKVQEGVGVNIGYIIEPEEVIADRFYADIINISHRFKYILTDKEEILAACPNAILFEFGTAWIQYNPFPEKIYGVSTVIGFKAMAEGHRIRHELWKRKNEISLPQYFYASQHGGPAFDEGHHLKLDDYNREQIFKTQFQIVIENKQTEYWFTEKLCDCFTTRVIPIYYGAKQINRFFDTSGMFIANSLDEIINICNMIDENTYAKMQESISINEAKVKKYHRLGDRLTDKLNELLG
jgi:hypothetical protein